MIAGRTLLIACVFLFSQTGLAQNAADEYFDAAAMAEARAALRAGHGSQVNTLILAERFEYTFGDGESDLVWEGQGWIGGDLNKFWIKTEGHYEFDESDLDEFELQLLYSRAISSFWELQAGVRHDFEPDPSRSYATIGLQGLAPQWFELDAGFFLSDKGDLSARLEAEYELRLTQRLLLQPRLEINAAFSDDTAIGVASGLSTAEAGIRLRYEFRREIAPYIGVSWNHAFGDTRELLRSGGESSSEFLWLIGLRFWH